MGIDKLSINTLPQQNILPENKDCSKKQENSGSKSSVPVDLMLGATALATIIATGLYLKKGGHVNTSELKNAEEKIKGAAEEIKGATEDVKVATEEVKSHVNKLKKKPEANVVEYSPHDNATEVQETLSSGQIPESVNETIVEITKPIEEKVVAEFKKLTDAEFEALKPALEAKIDANPNLKKCLRNIGITKDNYYVIECMLDKPEF